jgi:hypothetical protein
MADLRPRRPRFRLDPDSYRKLRTEVFKRDCWRCQYCDRSDRLEVHHIRSPSRLGDDVDENAEQAVKQFLEPILMVFSVLGGFG